MAFGTWNENDRPTLPGAYHNIKAKAQNRLKKGIYGVLAMPVKSNWGPVDEFVTVKNEFELKNKFGDSEEFTAYRLGKLCLLGNPKELLLYRLVDGSEACSKITLKDTSSTPADILKIESKYPTTRAFSITVRESITDETKKDLILYEGSKQLFVFNELSGAVSDIAKIINDSSDNEWINATVVAEGNAVLANIVNQKLTGGNDGVSGITNQTYIDALTKFEGCKFNAFCLDGFTDEALNTTLKSWEERLITSGMNIIVFAGSPTGESIANINTKSKAFNHEGMVYSAIGGYYNGEYYPPSEAICYIAAVSAGQTLAESICNFKTIFTDVDVKLTRDQQKVCLASGTLIMIKEDDGVYIVDDVNTLKTFNENQTEAWGYIRAIKFMNAVKDDTNIGAISRIGKTINDRNGQLAVLSLFKQYFDEYVNARLIDKEYIVEVDEELQSNAKKDEFFWRWDAEYIEVMKRIYGTGYMD